MTICNKIQTLGETMETNLNARGVSCAFGTGTGESTVLDMVEMVNGTNFKGSSDVNLKIGANRPYLLENETTDVVVKLENGLCEPLKNKNVIVGKSVFRDGGTTSNYSKWDSTNSSTSLTRLNDYTELKRTENASTFAWITKSLSVTDGITIEFDLKQATLPSSNKTYFTFRATGGSVKLGIYKSYENLADGQWHHYKFDVNGLTVTPTIDGVQRDDLPLSANFNYVQMDASEEAIHHFKNFVIYNNINGVTDGKGEFALYDVSVTDDTIFIATYGTETATCLVEHCTFVDYGVTNNNNLIQWYYAPSYSSASVDENGTTFAAVRDGSFATVSATLTQNPTSTDIYPYSFPLTVEFDLIEWEDNQGTTTDYARIRVYNSANNNIAYWGFKDYGVGHYKVVCTESSQKLYYNGVEQSRKFTFTPTTQWNVAFQTKGHIKFHNFAIY